MFYESIFEHEDIAIGAGSLGSIPGPVKLDTVSSTARHRCNVPGVKSRRWIPPLVTRFGVISRLREYDKDCIFHITVSLIKRILAIPPMVSINKTKFVRADNVLPLKTLRKRSRL